MTESEIRERIAQLEAILASGAASVSVDGTSVSYDAESIRQTLRELQSMLPDPQRRPMIVRVRLDNAF